MKKNALIWVIVLIFCFNGISLKSNISFKASIDTNNLKIGETIKVKLVIKTDKLYNVIWGKIIDSTNKVETIGLYKYDTVKIGNKYEISKILKITSFDAGEYNIEPISVIIDKGEENLYPLTFQLPKLKFRTLKIDSATQLIDIKPPYYEAPNYIMIILYILAGIIVIVGIIFLIRYLKRRKSNEKPIVKYDPKIPAHILALRQLRELEAKKLWQKEEVKRYYIELTEIIRLYIERRFNINALEMTTSQIKENMTEFNLDSVLRYNFVKMLENADLVKFAKHTTLPDENSMAMKLCIEFIESTKQINTEVE